MAVIATYKGRGREVTTTAGRKIFKTVISGGPRDKQSWSWPSKEAAFAAHSLIVGLAYADLNDIEDRLGNRVAEIEAEIEELLNGTD